MESASCWSQGFTPEYCCDLDASPQGRWECWDDKFTFARCCGASGATPEGQGASLQPLPDAEAGGGAADSTVLDCWTGGFTASFCCDTDASPWGRTECWGGAFTFEACCAGRPAAQPAPADPLEQCAAALRACRECTEVLAAPAFGRQEWQRCRGAGNWVWAVRWGPAAAASALCVPPQGGCALAMFPQLQQSLAGDNRGHLPIFDESACLPPWTGPVYCALAFWLLPCAFRLLCGLLALMRRLSAKGCSGHAERHCDACRSKQSGSEGATACQRNEAVDFVRLLGTAAVVMLHVNLKGFTDYSSHWYCPNVNHLHRCIDAFTVASVMCLAREPLPDVRQGLEALARKLLRVWPVYAFPRYLLNTALCPRAPSCGLSNTWEEAAPLRALLLFRLRGHDRHSWALAVDVRVTLTVLALANAECRWGAAAARAAAVALLLGGLLEGARRGPLGHDYESFAAYRLPMAMLVLLIARGLGPPRLRAGPRRRALRALIGALLLGGWAACPQPATRFSSPDCAKRGHGFLLGGASFHAGLALLCLRPQELPRVLVPPAGAAELSFALLAVHNFLHQASQRCERRSAGQSWFYTELAEDGMGRVFYSADASKRRWYSVAAVRVATVLLAVVVSKVMVLAVQRPWASLLGRIPRRLQQCGAALFATLVVWDTWAEV